MVKINENEVAISRQELFALIGTAGTHYIKKNRMDKRSPALTDFSIGFARIIYTLMEQHIWDGKRLPQKSIDFLMGLANPEIDGVGTKSGNHEGMAHDQYGRGFRDRNDQGYPGTFIGGEGKKCMERHDIHP